MTDVIKIIKDSLPSDHPLHRIKAEEIRKWSNESIYENKYDPHNCMEVIKLSINVLKNHGLFSTTTPGTSYFIQNVSCYNFFNKTSEYLYTFPSLYT